MWRGGSPLEPISENGPNREKTTEKKAPPSLLQQSGAVRKFPYRYFMERKSFDAPSPLWSEVRWGRKKKKREGRVEMKERGKRKVKPAAVIFT